MKRISFSSFSVSQILREIEFDSFRIMKIVDYEVEFRDSVSQILREIEFAQCGNFMIFLLLRFDVKSTYGILEVQKLPSLHI